LASLRIHLLGPFHVTVAGVPVTTFESDKVRALLALLVTDPDRPHRRETLAGMLWPGQSERSARMNLRHALGNLRRVISDHQATPPFLITSRQTIQFNRASDAWADVWALLDLLEPEPGREGEVERLENAVDCYGGSYLQGFSLGDSPEFEEWALLTREQLQRLAVEALHRLASELEKAGEYERALPAAYRQVELDPWREKAHRQVMRLLALSGQRGAALAQYETCRQLLAQGLGVEPATQTTMLYDQIREGTLQAPIPPPSLRPRPPHNLPASLTPFVGRETEVADIQDLLQDPACRLLTLVGPGGIGKTRLALEAARRQVEGFHDGGYLVPLAEMQPVEAMVPAIAAPLGFSLRGQAEPEQQLLDYLAEKTMLLILDSFEHLLSPMIPSTAEKDARGVGLILDILRAAPGVTLLVTSRARLNLKGEQLYPVAGLTFPRSEALEALPITQYDAVQLFLDAARRVCPDFQLAGQELHVTRICQMVEGMPLAILLAAAWSGLLTPAEIAARISGETDDQEPGHGLDFLEADWHDLPTRQRSLQAVFDHSWNLLAEQEREVCQALSVFRSGFTQNAAGQVTGASMRELKALVDKSLLHRAPTGRYDLHDLVRQYAARRLGGSPATREAIHDRHSAYYIAALEQWAPDLKGPRQQVALSEMESDRENILAAWQWAVEQVQVERLDRAIEGLAQFFWARGPYSSGERAIKLAVDSLTSAAGQPPTAPGEALRVLACALAWQSNFSRLRGRTDLATKLQQQSLALLEGPDLAEQDTRQESALLFSIMGHTVLMSDYKRGRLLYQQSLELLRELGDRWWIATVVESLGRTARLMGADSEARQLFKDSLAIFQALDDQTSAARLLANLAMVALRQGQFEEAERLARESSVGCREEMEEQTGLAYSLLIWGEALEKLGKFADARSALEECLAIYHDLGNPQYVASAHAALGSVELHLGQYERARAQAQTALALARKAGLRFRIGHALLLLGCVALAESMYVEAQQLLQESIAVYQEIGEPADLGWAIAVSSYAARGLGRFTHAEQCLYDALKILTETQALVPSLYLLPAAALLWTERDGGMQAVALYALASRHPFVSKSRWFEDVAGREISDIASTLPPGARAAIEERGRAQDLEATAAELLAELGR
jgi:DNA-binding SARP family transcriptional activator/predicted ATPase/Flp pilus assembly protein TadD